MKITKRQLKRIIREGLADDAYEAGYNDALRDRPHGSNPDMRDLDPRSYDHGFDKGTAERMDLQRPSGTRGFYEGAIKEANVPSALGMEILSIKDALFDILMGVRYHDEELAADLELQIERLQEIGYKKA